jgi:uncharacterized repeat protein (TIGR03943 family)
VNTKTQGALVAMAGAVVVRLAVSGQYLDYLKTTMRLPLAAAGVVLIVLGSATLLRAVFDTGGPEHADGTDHGDHGDHHRGPPIAWLLVLPLLAVVLVAPPPLGADAARRDTAASLPPPRSSFPALPPPRDGAVNLPLNAFLSRAYYDHSDSLAGVTLRLTGFVVSDPALPDGYHLTRFQMVCCAADAIPIKITVRGLDAPAPADDTWVEVTGQWAPPADPNAIGVNRGAIVDATSHTEIPPPANPYE